MGAPPGMANGAEQLVVDVMAAHNLMPKDGHGSSSAYVEVEFQNQRRRTSARPRDLNPVWNERLAFHVADPADLPYRYIDVAVYNEPHADAAAAAGPHCRGFLGRVRVPVSGVPAPGEPAHPQLFPLEKRSLFSHIRGEITLKIYRAPADEADGTSPPSTVTKPKSKKLPAQSVVAPPSLHTPKEKPRLEPILLRPPAVHLPVGVTNPTVLPPGPEPYPLAGGFRHGGNGGHEFAVKETRPRLGGAGEGRNKASATYDLVEQMQYLYVRVVRARGLPFGPGTGPGETHAEVKLGNYRGVTASSSLAHWNQVFAFSKDSIQSSAVEVFVRDRGGGGDDFVGRVWFDLSEVPRRAPPDSTLAPQWYRMEDKKGDRTHSGELMVAVWFGTQADEAFAEAWHSKAAGVHGDGALGSIKSKVYVAPKLWYLRVSIIEAQDLLVPATGRYPELFARARVAGQVLRTRSSPTATSRPPTSPVWNDDLIFVVAEPFDDMLLITVEDRVAPGRDEVLGQLAVPVGMIERRWDDKQLVSRWFALDGGGSPVGPAATGGRLGSRVHVRLSLDGGYHVLDESAAHSSDFRPTAKQLWAPHVGVLEVGVLGATGLMPMKSRSDGRHGGTTDAYCVAKYGQKWIRTRTAIDSTCPQWNEQYTWEVYDPCTVVTVGVFDNSRVDKLSPSGSPAGPAVHDKCIGKVRIRLSTLDSDRVYTHAYPLIVLHPSGVKKMGELHLAVRFSCANFGNMLHTYTRPPLPRMHYTEPLLLSEVERLRYWATKVIAARLGRAEPPLGPEVVEFMLDHRFYLWSMRRSKANFFRLVGVLSVPIDIARRLEFARSWSRPVYSCSILFTYLSAVTKPELILPTFFLLLAFQGLLRYRSRQRHPPHMDARLSHADAAVPDELDEEFDAFAAGIGRSPAVLQARYDRLRGVAGRVQAVVGDLASQGERLLGLLSWRDPRATMIFLVACLVAAILFLTVPIKLLLAAWGVYMIRPPRFRARTPSPVMCFFRRLPSRADSLL